MSLIWLNVLKKLCIKSIIGVMKVAVLFRGISYTQEYKHWSNKCYKIDFRDNIDNVQKMFIQSLKESCDVDVYYSTYEHDFLHLLEHSLEPVKTSVLPNQRLLSHNHNTYVLEMMLEVLNLVPVGISYDFVYLTRFDVNFLSDRVTNAEYRNKDVTFLCKAIGLNKYMDYNDDTLIVMKGEYLDTFKNVVRNLIQSNTELGHHFIYDMLIRRAGFSKDTVSFVYDKAYEIALNRPLCYFNREVDYRPEEFVLPKLHPLPYVKYKHNKCVIEYQQDGNEFVYFKHPDVSSTLHFFLDATTTLAQVTFEIMFLSEVPSMEQCVLQYGADVKKIDWLMHCKSGCFTLIRETFYVKKCKEQVIDLTIAKGISLHCRIRNVRIVSKEPRPRIHFVSFTTEGPPYDNCLNMTASRDTYMSKISPFVDYVKFYTPRELCLKPETEIYIRPFKTTPNPYNPGVHNIGFLRWKPYIILKELEKVRDGDIIYYRDGNLIKYPSIVDGVENTRDLIDTLLKENGTDVFVPIENYPTLKMKKNVKREIFEELGKYDDEYLEAFGYNSSIVICRKSPLSMNLIREWLDGCMKDHLITYEAKEGQHPDFGWNVQEQSILNVILKRYTSNGLLPAKFPVFSLMWRKFNIDDLVRVPKVAVLVVGEMRNFDNENVVCNNNLHMLKKYNCDVFVSTWTKRGFSYNHGYFTQKGYQSDLVSRQAIDHVYPSVKGVNIEDHEAWYSALDDRTKKLYQKGFYNNGNHNLCPATVFPQLYKLWDASRMKCEYEQRNGFKYDIVIKFRGDMCLVEDIPEDITKLYMHPTDITPTLNKLFHLNPPRIYDPDRVYDIFFFGRSEVMDKIADSWLKVNDLIDHPFDDNLANVNTCRVLYIQAIISGIKVVDIPRCIGDIYRDESFEDYVRKVLYIFNDPNGNLGNGFYGNTATTPVVRNTVGKCLKGNMGKFLRH